MTCDDDKLSENGDRADLFSVSSDLEGGRSNFIFLQSGHIFIIIIEVRGKDVDIITWIWWI